MDSSRPDVIIGVDFGMTCTGVAYQKPQMVEPHVIKKWPGLVGTASKVPTEMDYQGDHVQRWGFQCGDEDDSGGFHCEWFKTYLDPMQLQKRQQTHAESAPKSLSQVKKWFQDYLSAIYRVTQEYVSGKLEGSSWVDAKILFIFSLPTTWTSLSVVEDFRAIIERSGFGHGGRRHSVEIGLTEAEAAGVYTVRNQTASYQEGDVMLVCDAGGGTTDISILKTAAVHSQSPGLTQLIPVQGENIGSTSIDIEFERCVEERLNRMDPSKKKLHAVLAYQASKSTTYHKIKCFFGTAETYTPEIGFKIPNIGDINNVAAGIRGGKMIFQYSEFAQIFNVQIEKIFILIDKQLAKLQQSHPNETVKYLVLSGGLGSSAYVRDRLRERYQGSGRYLNAMHIKVLQSDEPQEAVVKGIVSDRHQVRPILKERCCRASYGVLCQQLYNKDVHVGLNVIKDPINGKRYVTNMIQWFIKEGEPISTENPIQYPFFRVLKPNDPRRKWKTKIVTSQSSRALLPAALIQGTSFSRIWTLNSLLTPPTLFIKHSSKHKSLPNTPAEGAHILCEVESNLIGVSQSQFKEKGKGWWKCTPHHFIAQYSINVMVGAADLRFELYFNGMKYSKDESIAVEWAAAPEAEKGPHVASTYGGVLGQGY